MYITSNAYWGVDHRNSTKNPSYVIRSPLCLFTGTPTSNLVIVLIAVNFIVFSWGRKPCTRVMVMIEHRRENIHRFSG